MFYNSCMIVDNFFKKNLLKKIKYLDFKTIDALTSKVRFPSKLFKFTYRIQVKFISQIY